MSFCKPSHALIKCVQQVQKTGSKNPESKNYMKEQK